MAAIKTTMEAVDDSPVVQPAANTPAPRHTATPENTPVPGGGSWMWDASVPGWVANAPDQSTPKKA